MCTKNINNTVIFWRLATFKQIKFESFNLTTHSKITKIIADPSKMKLTIVHMKVIVR